MSFRPVPPLTPEEREQLRPKPPPVNEFVRACRNLALHSPRLHRDGITTELDEDAFRVLVRRGDQAVHLTATSNGWATDPNYPELHLPLESTVPLERQIHAILTQSD
ncbi:hypothetical protein J4H86_06315 [Spiractinospora alimapuensis]|uniref:hypothetical protein n=1 Tax=Spiractinospora alimapuensis TaxID=2820884 RepID=UPI001F229DCC|nr:hypothetical protein [Spiractinospora alimapuensis]QVQ53370.1 hypothetical protein J4H86_06315 [Spiractinospora alimapuensis]